MTDTITLSSHDQAIIDQLDRELGFSSATREQLFKRALELGASDHLLKMGATSWLERDANEQLIALPYVPLLLQYKGKGFARDFIRAMCTEPEHSEAFWRDQKAQALFDERDSSFLFAVELARHDPNRLLSAHYETLCAWLTRVGADDRYLAEVEEEAAKHLEYLDSRQALDTTLKHLHDSKELSRLAARCPANGWNLVVKGYVLAKHSASRREQEVILSSIHQQVMSYPHQGAIIYRWLMEGATRYAEWMIEQSPTLRYSRAEVSAEYDLNDQQLGTDDLPGNGWMIRTLDANWQVRLPGRSGLPIVFRHDRNHPDAEFVQPGSRVIVAEHLTQGLTAKVTPAGRIYTLPLQPARRPTAKLLDDSHHHFYVGNIQPVDWRKDWV